MLTRAREVFPFDHRFQRGVADYYMAVRWHGSLPAGEAAIRSAINYDTFALDLHRILAGMCYADKNMACVNQETAFIRAYMPGKPITILVNQNPATD
jgi:hypothetical protein